MWSTLENLFLTGTLIIMQNSVVVSRKCALGCPKNFGDAGPRPLGLGRCDPLETRCYSTCVILPNFVTLVQTVWAQVELSKKNWDVGGVSDSLETCCSTAYHAKLVLYASVIEGDTVEKLTPQVPLFKVTQGHWNRHGLIGYL